MCFRSEIVLFWASVWNFLGFLIEFFWVFEWNYFSLSNGLQTKSARATHWNSFGFPNEIILGFRKEFFWASEWNSFELPKVILLAFWTEYVVVSKRIFLYFRSEIFPNGILRAFDIPFLIPNGGFGASGRNNCGLSKSFFFWHLNGIIVGFRTELLWAFNLNPFGLPNGIIFGY